MGRGEIVAAVEFRPGSAAGISTMRMGRGLLAETTFESHIWLPRGVFWCWLGCVWQEAFTGGVLEYGGVDVAAVGRSLAVGRVQAVG